MSNNLPATTPKRPFLTNTQYDALKFVAQILLPALGALYAALALLWGFPAVEQVVGSIVAIDTFLGVALGFSSKTYAEQPPNYDGYLEIVEHDTSLVHQLDIRTEPEDIAKKDAILIKVVPKHLAPYEGEFPEDKLK